MCVAKPGFLDLGYMLPASPVQWEICPLSLHSISVFEEKLHCPSTKMLA